MLRSNRTASWFTVTRAEVEANWPGSIVAQLFAHQSPRCGFTCPEQQVLIRAADGLTDAKIASVLGITPAAVSLRWRSIYARLLESVPVVPRLEDDSNGARGQEKRRNVIAFINEHPEELRPYARRGRRNNTAGRRKRVEAGLRAIHPSNRSCPWRKS